MSQGLSYKSQEVSGGLRRPHRLSYKPQKDPQFIIQASEDLTLYHSSLRTSEKVIIDLRRPQGPPGAPRGPGAKSSIVGKQITRRHVWEVLRYQEAP